MKKSKSVKQSLLCLFAALCIFSLSGCYSVEEVDTKAYPIAIAIDKVGDKIELGVQFGKVIKGAEGGTPTEEGNIVIKYEGLSIYDAFEKLNNRTSKQLSYAQIKALILSEEFAREGIMPLIYSLVDSYNVYPNLYIMVSEGSAVRYLDEQKIWMETTPSKFYELFYDKAYRSFLNVMTISEIAFRQISSQSEIVVPYITYIQDGENQGEFKEENQQSEEKRDQQDSVNDQSKNNVEWDPEIAQKLNDSQVLSVTPSQSEITRLAIFKDGKMLDYLQGEQIEAYGLIKGDYFKANISVPAEEDFSRLINVYLQNKVKPIKKVEIIDGVPHISVDIRIRVTKISSVSAPEYLRDIPKAEALIEDYIKKICMELATNTKYVYNSDILGFGEYVKSNFKTYQEFENYDWKSNYQNAEFDIRVKAEAFTNYLVLDPDYETQAR